MPVFRLSRDLVFPDPRWAEPDGLLAVGGDLSCSRLLLAYSMGIFPWYDAKSPILWWSPEPRPVVIPGKLHVSRRLARRLRQNPFVLTVDRDFSGVIRACAATRRKKGQGTWILPAMIRAYEALFEAGHAHSVEAWRDGELVGGIYGVAVGRAFFGESMFHLATDASKAALVHLVGLLETFEYHFMDCQQATGHMRRFGTVELPRTEFMARLETAVALPGRSGRWDLPPVPAPA